MELVQPDEDASEFFSAALSFLDGGPLLDLALGEEDYSIIGAGGGGVALLGGLDATEALLASSDEDTAVASFEAPRVAAAGSSVAGFPLSAVPVLGAAPNRSSELAMAATALPLVSDKRRPVRKQLIHSNSNKARDERKLELLYLRQKVQDMEQQLRTLRASRLPTRDGGGRKRGRSPYPGEAKEAGAGAGAGAGAAPLNYTPLDSSQHEASFAAYPGMMDAANQPQVWKAMCLRQIQHRAKAERENVRLKRVLEGQIKIAKSMEKLLRKPTEHIGTSLSKRSKSLHVPPTDPAVDNLIFQKLMAGIDETYHEINDVFQTNGLTTLETSHRGAQMREGPNGMFLDVFVNSVLPFDMDSTAEAVWEHYKGPQKHHGSLYEKTAQTLEPMEDTILENFALELFANNTLADFRVWQVVRRYKEDDRVVIVWISDVVPVEVAHKRFSGIGFQEKGYVVCKRPRSTAESSPNAFTVVQVCYRITPHATTPGGPAGARPTASSSKDIGTLTEFVLGTTEMNVVAHQELIENVLLEQAFKRRGLR